MNSEIVALFSFLMIMFTCNSLVNGDLSYRVDRDWKLQYKIPLPARATKIATVTEM
jgi:hypothetical protein